MFFSLSGAALLLRQHGEAAHNLDEYTHYRKVENGRVPVVHVRPSRDRLLHCLNVNLTHGVQSTL